MCVRVFVCVCDVGLAQNLKELRSAEEEEESQEDIGTYVCVGCLVS